MRKIGELAALAATVVIAVSRVAMGAPIPGIFTYHYNNARDGQNTNETILTPSSVNSKTFGKLFFRVLDGYVYAEPLYVNSVQIPAVGTREVVYVATEHDSVYAFDATGATTNPFWKVSFINPKAKVTTVPWGKVGTNDLVPEIGITGTPVIDPASNTLYVAVATLENGKNYFERLHALDLSTGQEKFGGPIEIKATAPGKGPGGDGQTLTFTPRIANQRSGLALNNGIVYVSFASHGDVGDYHGWVLGYDASTLQQVSSFVDTPNGSLGGIWMAGGAPMIDPDGNLFLVTGNGSFSADQNGVDYGDSLLKLGPTGTSKLDVVDFFTPTNQATLDQMDIDFGSSGVIALPDQTVGPQHLAFTGGKEGTLYLIDRDNMGHFSPTEDQERQQIVQAIPGLLNHVFSTPAYFNGRVYVGDEGQSLKAFSLSNGQLSTEPIETSVSFPFSGATPVVSANGTQNGIVWAIRNAKTAVLEAFDASDLHELYNSAQMKKRDVMTGYVKFTVPTVANGRVFVGSQKRVSVFGLLRTK